MPTSQPPLKIPGTRSQFALHWQLESRPSIDTTTRLTIRKCIGLQWVILSHKLLSLLTKFQCFTLVTSSTISRQQGGRIPGSKQHAPSYRTNLIGHTRLWTLRGKPRVQTVQTRSDHKTFSRTYQPNMIPRPSCQRLPIYLTTYRLYAPQHHRSSAVSLTAISALTQSRSLMSVHGGMKGEDCIPAFIVWH